MSSVCVHALSYMYMFPNYLSRNNHGLESKRMSFVPGCPLNFLSYTFGLLYLISLMSLIGIGTAKIAKEKEQVLKVVMVTGQNDNRIYLVLVFVHMENLGCR